MTNQKRTTIFKQLTLNVMVPPILALLLLGFLNFNHTRKILIESSQERNYIIADEITKVLEFQDVALNLVETRFDKRMVELSQDINSKLINITDIEKYDLAKLQIDLGMNPIMEDIYIINQNGIVVNTTFKKDLMLDFFSFGDEHKNMLLAIFENKVFKTERFAIEASTKRLKKYSYQPTSDGKYIIELGFYSSEADEIIDFIKNTTKQISDSYESINNVELFIGGDNPFSLNRNAIIEDRHADLLKQTFVKKDTVTFEERNDKQTLLYQFIYMDRKNTELYKGSVIRIISDRTSDYRDLRLELIKFLSIFSITLLLVTLLIYVKTKIITDPIKNLVVKVNRITHGHLNERAEVIGNNEITTLSKQFNLMIEELESYYNELEEKVKQRTLEIQQQKEEIAAQRDAIESQRNMLADKNDSLESAYKEIQAQKKHITDSIVYAKRIQNAILPSVEYIDKLVPDYFLLYKPKDIVSGDFYWLDKAQGKVIVAAVDCTGHGVPGAFMSIIGSNQLDYAVNTKKAKTAGQILDYLNEGVATSLRQESGKSTVRDGMDISVLTIDYKTNIVEFSAAYNPLYLVQNGEMIEIKADKIAIGSFIENPDRKYTTHTIQANKGDVFYIFSDGYADQFGGPNGRKFMYKQFRELILSISHLPLTEQKEILDKANEDWKNNEVQVDDIIVIGIRI